MKCRATFHVLRATKGWDVRRHDAQRVGTYGDKADAIRVGRSVAKREGAILYIHSVDGEILDRFNYSGRVMKPVRRWMRGIPTMFRPHP